MTDPADLTYVITVSRRHFLPAQMCILTLRQKTSAPIVVVGNLEAEETALIRALGAQYLDEREVDVSSRLPRFAWDEKYREVGWYRQMFFRLSIDRYIDTAQAVILDSEVFVFDNWDEARLYDPITHHPRCFYWVPAVRKPDWDYRMYRGAAYLLRELPGFKSAFEYANSDSFRRHISGVVLFSTANVDELWTRLERETDLEYNLDQLFNCQPDLAFSDHDLYGIAAEYGLFEGVVPTVMCNNLLGWYDNHHDPHFQRFRKGAMWSMCQRYNDYPTPTAYRQFMVSTAKSLGTSLPVAPYWNPEDRGLIEEQGSLTSTIDYFHKYRRQLDYTNHARSSTMTTALSLLSTEAGSEATIVEIGTLRDNAKGGGHATYKFGEYCSRFGGVVHTVDISETAIAHSMHASSEFQPWIRYHLADSEEFLATFEGSIDLLYLDGLDALAGDEELASRKQLAEVKTALPHLAERSLVLLDDADLPDRGKTQFSGPFLASCGFTLLVDSYQQLYGRGFRAEASSFRAASGGTVVPRSRSSGGEFASMAEAQLDELISQLPEIYQPIYGRPSVPSSRLPDARDKLLVDTVDRLAHHLNRPLRVLELGSAQGYFSFLLAERGHHITGVDSLGINVEVARTIAGQHPNLDVEFMVEDALNVSRALDLHSYDVVVAFSVLHHIAHRDGHDVAREFVAELAEAVPHGLFEMAVASEPVFWSEALPSDPRVTLAPYAFLRELGRATTHLSDVRRPIFFCSRSIALVRGQFETILSWDAPSHAQDGGVAIGTRRYYMLPCGIAKVAARFREGVPDGISHQLRQEVRREAQALEALGKVGLEVPNVLEFVDSSDETLLVRTTYRGVVLSEVADRLSDEDRAVITSQLLTALAELERLGLYHGDLRLWNLIWDQESSELHLIDFGAISTIPIDSMPPGDAHFSLLALMSALWGRRADQTGLDVPRSSGIDAGQLPWRAAALVGSLLAHPRDDEVCRDLAEDWERICSGPEDRVWPKPPLAWGWLTKIEQQSQVLSAELIRVRSQYDNALERERLLGALREELERAAQDLITERDALLTKVAELTEERDLFRADRDARAAELASTRRTLSWRLTAPLRRLRKLPPAQNDHGTTLR